MLSFKGSQRDNLIQSCKKHIDVNYDMLCDSCESKLPLSNYVENKSVETVANDNSFVKVSGAMPKGTKLETVAMPREEAIDLAQKYVQDIASEDVLCAYDIAMISNTIEYQPEDFNQVVKVNISNLDLDLKDTVALLHIIDENNYEILPLSSVNANELEFKATRFSPYILIYVDTYTIAFNGEQNFKVLDLDGNEIANGTEIPAGVNFSFIIDPKKGYEITDVSLTDATTDKNGNNYLEITNEGTKVKCRINKVAQDLEINVGTIEPDLNLTLVTSKIAPEITAYWVMQEGIKYSLYYTNENGELTLIKDNVISPYVHNNLENNTTYEYTIIGRDPENDSYLSKDTAIGQTEYDDSYDIIYRDVTKPVLDNVTVVPYGEVIGPNSEVVITFNVTDEHYNYLNGSLIYPDEIEVLVDGLNATTAIKEITKETITNGEKFTLKITNIWGNGELTVKIPAGSIKDLALNGMDEYIITTKISVVRNLIRPVSDFSATSGDKEDSIELTWIDDKNTETLKYVIEASAENNTWVVLSNNAVSPFTHSGLTKNRSFEYRIKAVNSEGDSSEYVYATGRTTYDSNFDDVMIDTVNPVINFVGINPKVTYLGSTQEINIIFESYDENYNNSLTTLLNSSFVIKVGGETINSVTRTLTKENISNGEKFTLNLKNVTGTGYLTVGVPAGVIRDSALNPNIYTECETGVRVINGDTTTKDAPTLVPDVDSIAVTTNQISTVEIANIIYEYRVKGDSNFIVWEETTRTDTVITGLTVNTNYEVRTTIVDVANNKVVSNSAFTTTMKMDASKIEIDYETKAWTNLVEPNPKIIATITWNDTTYIHQYSLDGTTWVTGAGATTDVEITKNLTIYARYTDGGGYSDPVQCIIGNIDQLKPTIGKVTIPTGTANSKEITVSGIADTGGSEIYGYYVSSIADLNKASWKVLSSTSFTFTATENRKYYIWVKDNAGNISVASEANVTGIATKVTDAKVEPAEIKIDVFEKATPELSYTGNPKTITWTIVNTNVATIDSTTGEITGVGAGTTTAKVTLTDYDGTKTEISITVIVSAVTPELVINNPKEFTFTYGDANGVTTFTNTGKGTISVTSTDPNVAVGSVDGNKIIVTPKNVGEATLTVAAASTSEYIAVSQTIKVQVNPKPVEITWTTSTFKYDETEKEITASVTNKVGTDTVNVTAYEDNKKINAGTYIAKVTALSNKNYTLERGTGLTKEWTITKADRTMSDISESITMVYGTEERVTFTYTGEDSEIIALGGSGLIVNVEKIDGNCLAEVIITTIAMGTDTVTIMVPATENYNAITKTFDVTVTLAEEGITVDSKNVVFTYGDDSKNIGYNYDGNGEITISSSNPSAVKATLDKENKVINLNPLRVTDEVVTIRIIAAETEQYKASETQITAKVNPRDITLSWSGDKFKYTGTEKSVVAFIDNLIEGDIVDVTYEGNKATNVGTYTAKVKSISNTNYTIANTPNLTHSWEITPSTINPTVKMDSYVYGGNKKEPTTTGNVENGEETFYVYASDKTPADAITWDKVTNSTYLTPGKYKMYVTIAETQNYEAATTIDKPVEFEITIENITVKITENGVIYDNQWTNSSVVATVTVPTNITSLETVYYRVGDEIVIKEHEQTVKNDNKFTITFDENIDKTLYFVAVDSKGNKLTTESGPYTIKIDKTKPQIENVVVEPEVNVISNSKIIEVSDIIDNGGSGIQGYYVGSNVDVAIWTPLTEDNFKYTVTKNGTYNIYVKDNAGNISDITPNVTGIEITTIVEKVSNATMSKNLEIEVFKTIGTNVTYTGEACSITYTVADPNVATIDQTTGVVTAINVGETKVIAVIRNYNEDIADIILEATLKVTPRIAKISWTGENFVYDKTAKTVTATITNTRPEDTVVVTKYTDNEKTDVGEYTATIDEISDSNYTLVGADNTSHNWSIIAATITPTIIMDDYVYGGILNEPSIIGNYSDGEVTIYIYGIDERELDKISWSNVKNSIYLKPGKYYMYAEIEETPNYKGARTETIEFEIFMRELDVSITEESANGNPYDETWTNKNIVVTITVPTDVTTYGSVYCRESGETVAIPLENTVEKGNVTTITFNKTTDKALSFVAVNTEGKIVTEETDIFTVKIDKNKPQIDNVEIIPNVTETSNKKEVKVTGITDDGGSGLYGYYVGPETLISNITWIESTANSFSYELTQNRTDNICVIDNAGNISNIRTIAITNIVDKLSNLRVQEEITLTVFEKGTPELTYDGYPKNIKWEIEDEKIATIDAVTGEITAMGSGETVATVTGTDYDGTMTTATVKVIIRPVIPTIQVNEPREFTFVYGDENSETTFNYSADGALSVTSNNDNVAVGRIEGNKIIVIPVKVGEATLTITAKETTEYASVSDTIKVTVAPRPVSLKWSATTFTYDGKEKEVIATVENVVLGDTVNVSKYQDNKKTTAGEYIAIAKEIDNSNYTLEGGIGLENAWRINKAGREIIGVPQSITVIYGQPENIKFTYTGEDTSVIMDSVDNSVIAVDFEDGVLSGEITIEAVTAGLAMITISVPETDNYVGIEKTIEVVTAAATADITVNNRKVKLQYGDLPIDVGYKYGGNGEVSVEVTNKEIIDVILDTENKKLTIKPLMISEEEVTITIVAAATPQYRGSRAEIKVTVTPKALEFIWSGDPFIYDGEEKEVTVEISNLEEGDIVNYRAVGTKGTDAGQYSAVIINMDNSNYTLEGSKTAAHFWEIKKADIHPILSMEGYILGGDKKEPSITGNKGNGEETIYVYASGDVEASAINWNTVTSSGYLRAGWYKIFGIVDETSNYNSGKTNTVEFEIVAEDIEVEMLEKDKPYDNEWTNNTIIATITVPETVTQMTSVYYRVEGEETFKEYPATTREGNKIIITFAENIKKDVYFAAINSEGYIVSNENGVHLLRIDKSKPKIGSVVVEPEIGETSNTKIIKVSDIIDEGDSEVYGYYVGTDLENAVWTPLTEDNFTYKVTENGKYDIYVKDNTGNISDLVEGVTSLEITTLVDEVTNAKLEQNLEVEVFKTITPELTYSGEAKKITYTIENSNLATVDQESGTITAKNAGTTKLIVTIENYGPDEEDVVLETSLTITRKVVTLSWSGKVLVYNGRVQSVIATVTNARTEDTVVVNSYTDNSKEQVGNYTAVAKTLNNSNYTLEGCENASHDWSIIQGTLEPELIMNDYIYGGDKPTPEIVGNKGSGDVTIYVYASTASKETKENWNEVTDSTYLLPGTYKMYAEIAETDGYEAAVTDEVEFTILIRDLEVELTENGTSYDNEWTTNTVIAKITVPTDVTTLKNIYYRVEGETTLRDDLSAVQSGNITTITFSTNYNKEIYFVGVNAAGKPVTNESLLTTIKIDKDKPTIGKITVEPDETVAISRRDIIVSNITDEGGSGLYAYCILLNTTDLTNAEWILFTEDTFTYLATEEGTYTVYAKDTAGNISDSISAQVKNLVPGITNIVVDSEVTVKVNDKVTPTLTYEGEVKDITWVIDDEEIATINKETGEITGVASGETIARVILTNLDGPKDEREIKVTVTAITPILTINTPTEFTFEYGDSNKNTTFSYNGNGNVIVKTSNSDVATATISGTKVIVTPKNVGTATLTVVAESSPQYVEVSKTINVTVNPRPVTLTWSNDTFTYDGTTKTITATVTNKVGTDKVNVTAYTDNQKTNAGTYKAVATSLDNASYTLEGGTNINKNWTIDKADRNLAFIPAELEMTYGANDSVYFSYEGGDAVTNATSNNESIVTVSNPEDKETGHIVVTPHAEGETKIIVTVAANSNYKAASKELNVKVLKKSANIIVANSNVTSVYGDEPVEVTFEYTGNALLNKVTAVSNEEAIAKAGVSENKILITPVSVGTTKVVVTLPATPQYAEATAEITVTVKPLPVVLTWNEVLFEYDGNEKEVTAKIDNLVGTDKVIITYKGNKATKTGNYTAEAISLSGAQGNNYTVVDGTNITHDWAIDKGERKVQISDVPVLEYGKEHNATISYDGEDVTVKVTVADESVAKVQYEDLNNSGNIKIIPQGSGETEITIVLPESASCIEKTVTIKITVKQAMPKIELVEDEIEFIYGDAVKGITYTAPQGIEINVESSNESVATGTVNGNKIVITPYNVGTATLTLKTVESPQYKVDTATINVTVHRRPVELDWGSKYFNYDGTEKVIKATVKNVILGDTVVIEKYTGNKATEVGTYRATVTKISNDNYTLVGGINVSAEWKIEYIAPPDIIVRQGEYLVSSDTWASGDVTVEIAIADTTLENVAYEYSYDAKNWYEYTGKFNMTEETTGTKIYARAYNNYTGVELSTIGEYTLKLDKIDPSIVIDSVIATNKINSIINKNSEVTIELSIKDLVSGMEANELTADDIKVIAINKGNTVNVTGITKILEADSLNSGLKNGTYSYTITLKGIDTDGKLSLRFDESVIKDRAGRYNQLKTIGLDLTADNTGPKIGVIKTSADEYGRVFSEKVNLEVTASDESGIKSYEWQISEDGISWETFIKEETISETSKVVYEALNDGMHHFRVIVTDIMDNSSISEMVSNNINLSINRKPTIRFETEQIQSAMVEITAIVKSTKPIVSIRVNSSNIDNSEWTETKTNNEITVTTTYTVVSNGTYIWTVEDSLGNIATEEINITTIDDAEATIVYETYNVTEYSPAKIVFKSNQNVRISKVIKPNKEEINIVTGKEIAGMTFSTIDFTKELNVKIKGIEFEEGTTFVFENKSFKPKNVVINCNIETKIMYIRTVSTGTELFNTLFGDTFTLEKAEMLVNQMAAKTKEIDGKITGYYGISNSSIELNVSTEDELKAIMYLAEELKKANGEGTPLKLNVYGDTEEIMAIIQRNTMNKDTNYANENITGIKTFGRILNWTGNAVKNTFRVTITPK